MFQIREFLKKYRHLLSKNSPLKGPALIVVLLILYKRFFVKSIAAVTLSQFLQLLSSDSISKIAVDGSRILFRPNDQKAWYQTNADLLTKDRLYKLLRDKGNVEFDSVVPSNSSKIMNIAIFAAFYYFAYKIIRYYMDKQTSGPAIQPEYSSNLKFTDIYGVEQAKNNLQEIIDFLKNPAKYKAVGARLRKGVLLYGPSGVGKTMLAKAVAGEAGVAFLSCAATEFVELYVGVGAKRVRELFQKARGIAPCIIFIDEIDGIGMKRKSQISGMETGSDDERNSTLNQLLIEMDGFKENKDIVIIAATNRATLLDEALLRSGRFDTKIKLELPNEEEREGIMRIHLRNKSHNISNDILKTIATQTVGYCGADLENLVNESAYCCVQHHREVISNQDIKEAFMKVGKQRQVVHHI